MSPPELRTGATYETGIWIQCQRPWYSSCNDSHVHCWRRHNFTLFSVSFVSIYHANVLGFTGNDAWMTSSVLACLRRDRRSRWTCLSLHTTLYGSAAAGCRSIQKTCAFWKNGLTFENTQSQLTYFCKSNINQTFANGNGMIWGVMIAIFTEIRHLVEELITFLYFFGPQKLSILTAKVPFIILRHYCTHWSC